MKRLGISLLIIQLLLLAVTAQDVFVGCSDDELTRQQETFAHFLTLDFAGDREMSLANLFRLGAIYQSMALDCGYAPNNAEVNVMLEQVLEFASLDDLIAAQSVGIEVDEILLELDEVYGDPLNGQLLYNGLEPALGGSPLGCAGCHENEAIAPLTAGTWTRINEMRLILRGFENYSHRQFLVESIVRPMEFVTPGYAAVMPEMYGGQLTIQQLADLVAFLDSQDQLLERE
ncbi:MAG: hypothetical protein OXI77_06140 [Chloroflexota bacterium]|nr:hypothetical protein [Chloroflexota bacterium]MDE2909789.1 hypothetical protein [Chloroflexota bacterium]